MVKLEVGKYYKRRDGCKVGPMVRNIDGEYRETHPFTCPSGYTYKIDGGYLVGNSEYAFDIIAEWTDEPVSPARTVTRKDIVPGQYGKVSIESYCVDAVEVSIDGFLTTSELRAAIATLTEIADAMEEQ